MFRDLGVIGSRDEDLGFSVLGVGIPGLGDSGV